MTTNNPYDLAIDDRALTLNKGQKPGVFFAALNTAGETRYTRNGRFTVDETGHLVTAEGCKVLNNQGNPLLVDPALASSEVSISPKGELILNPDNPANRKVVDTIGLVLIQNPNNLIKEGNGLFRWMVKNQSH